MKIHKGWRGAKTVLNVPYIRELLGSKGMSEGELAWLIGVAPSTMKRILTNETVDTAHAKRIADMLNVPIVKITLGS